MVLSLEGLEPLYDNLELLEMYYRFGVRAECSPGIRRIPLLTALTRKQGGLTHLGKEAVRKMNDLGILVDVSHLNEEGFWEKRRFYR